jgi:ABC-type dipeptide/oligopeptide/nickel transport system permease subunit
MIPWIMLGEMMLSFLGVTGNRISCGSMIAHGQHLIIEAPWMAVYPGVLASIVVMTLSFLGWRVSSLLRTGEVPRFL